jgi:transcription initiation factor TFIIIB Brf1 subunit/transcription initiation factor TFIIB
MTTDKIALLPCPFCGGDAARVTKAMRRSLKGKVTCFNSDCVLAHTYMTDAQWNTRTQPKETPSEESVAEAFENGKRVMLGWVQENGIEGAWRICDGLRPTPASSETGRVEFLERQIKNYEDLRAAKNKRIAELERVAEAGKKAEKALSWASVAMSERASAKMLPKDITDEAGSAFIVLRDLLTALAALSQPAKGE